MSDDVKARLDLWLASEERALREALANATIERDTARLEVARLRSLPVIETCGRCGFCGPTSGGWDCGHLDVYPAYGGDVGGPMVDADAAPPSWCPLRKAGDR